MKKAVLAYVPVIHQGYLALFDRHRGADIYLLTPQSLIDIDPVSADQLSRDIRAVAAPVVKSMLEDHDHYRHTKVLLFENLEQLRPYENIVMPDEDTSHMFKKIIDWAEVELDPAFLRWDWSKTTIPNEVVGKFPITTEEEHRSIMTLAKKQAQNSSDVWRQVGAAVNIVSKNNIIFAVHNEHMPSPYSPYVNGDVRLQMKPGERPEIGTAIHAEQKLIAQAARNGIPLNGLSIYVTTFPCSVCARMIAAAGIKKVFFADGYSNLDAAEILVHTGIEIFQVK